MSALRKWSEDELRSMNGQIEFLLRKALLQAGRLKRESAGDSGTPTEASSVEDTNETSEP